MLARLIFFPLELIWHPLERISGALTNALYGTGWLPDPARFNFVRAATRPVVDGVTRATSHLSSTLGPLFTIVIGAGQRVLGHLPRATLGRRAPGQEAAFDFALTSVPSSHSTFQWRMVEEEVEWFGDFTPPVPFVAPNDAICVQLTGEIMALENEIAGLQEDLQHAAGSKKMSLIHQIAQDDIKLAALQKQKQQNGCHKPGAVPHRARAGGQTSALRRAELCSRGSGSCLAERP